MFIDARSLPANHIVETDVCIVGAGAAGITLALEFAGSPFRVCLVESGGLERDAATQALYKGENLGLPYHPLDVTRLRYFGGTTNHWAGWCRPPTQTDFTPRDWIPESGWPYDKAILKPYFVRAYGLCQLGPYNFSPADWAKRCGYRPLTFADNGVQNTLIQYSPPTRFGRTYRPRVRQAPNVTTLLHANITRIETTDNGKQVQRLRGACLGGGDFSVKARLFVIAAGGIETPRLMLLSDQVQRGGVGNRHGLVGRYFMDHIKFEAGYFLSSDPGWHPGFYLRRTRDGITAKGNLRLSPARLRRERMLDVNFEFAPTQKTPATLDRHVANATRAMDGRRDSGAARLWRVMLRIDPAPNRDSRVLLVSERDALGQRRVGLDWRFSEHERHTFDRAQKVLGQALGADRLGRLHPTRYPGDAWPPPPGVAVPTGYHHMGTTRMHADPRHGVVDADCRVHGLVNLYLAGSSVFPNYEGYPTMTLVALALKLADHIKRRLA